MIITIKGLKSFVKQEVIDAEAQICMNSGIPDSKGTLIWSEIKEHLGGFWYIFAPPEGGWDGHSQEQMMMDVQLPISDIEILMIEEE